MSTSDVGQALGVRISVISHCKIRWIKVYGIVE